VDTLLQDFGNSSGIANAMNQNDNRFKKIVYDYDLISGKVNQVSYQPGAYDAYYHRYEYDAENRLTDVYTGRDSIMLEFFPEREAHYNYYKHGPLAQTILGQLQVQKQDYVYTLQGWLKGINPAMGGTLTNGTDTTEAFPIAQDVYGFGLHYYKNDYEAIGYTPQGTSVLGALSTNAAPLFNGNIAAMAVNIPKLGNTKTYNYHYDQLNRIVAMDIYNGLNVNNGTFTPVSVNDYRERISYDPNGNILTYDRYGDAARLSMDSLKYFYTANTNRLHKVTDAATDASPGDYSKYNDIKQGQADDNYSYDEIGNLIADNAEGITNVTWNVYGKIASLTKSGSLIKYVYDAAGNRIMKQTSSDTTIYVRDATGNVLSVYSKPANGTLVQSEMHLYGSSRIGMATLHAVPDSSESLSGGFSSGIKRIFVRGEKLFELGNHLGNVLATVSDKKIAVSASGDSINYYTADVSGANDYYPGGMGMAGRTYNAGNYRYGFNGQEMDNEIMGPGNSYNAEFWQYDSRVGRRWNLDVRPTVGVSQYSAFANNPIRFSDPFGDTTVTGAGGTHSIDIDEKVNELNFYGAGDYTANGKKVPVQAGQLQSFTNAAGTFKAKWNTTGDGVSFAGYLNDKNQSLEAAVADLNKQASSLLGRFALWAAGQYEQSQTNPLGYNLKLSTNLLLGAAMVATEPAPFAAGYNPSVTTQESMSGLGTLSFASRNGTTALANYWPANGGALGEWYPASALPGAKLDRIGGLEGSYLAPYGTPFDMRALPANGVYRAFEVVKPFPIQTSTTAPAFGRMGGGLQYRTPISIKDLLEFNYLKHIK
jgi:hypothetical protein